MENLEYYAEPEIECPECGLIHNGRVSLYGDNEFTESEYCEFCLPNHVHTCSRCGEDKLTDNEITVINGVKYCNWCVAEIA